jgi:RNA polymerase sigma-70 factor, ECF subfamily
MTARDVRHWRVGAGVVERDFADFYRLEFGRIVGAVRLFAGAAAEDVAQEAFFVAQQRWDEVATFDVPFAWVRRVAFRIAGRRAERDRMRTSLEAGVGLSDAAPSSGLDLDLVASLAELPRRHAAAVWLHHVEDRPVAEVADQLGCSTAAMKVLLLRTRRRLAGRVGGLTGRWISEQLWTPDRIVHHLEEISAGEHIGTVLDEDLEGRGGRWELTIADGAYRLYRDDGMRLDDGACNVRGNEVALVPTVTAGHVVFRTAIDGERMRLTMVEDTTPPTRGVPDPVWMSLFIGSGPFGYAGRPRLKANPTAVLGG